MSWSNYDDVLAQMRAAGLLVDDLRVDKFGRCKVDGKDRERRGWYRLHELASHSGELLLCGSFGIFRGTSSNAIKVELPKKKDGPSLSAEQRDALRKRIAEDKRRADAQRQFEAKRAAQRADQMWRKCSATGVAAYLERKGVGNHGCRFTDTGALVVPMLDVKGAVHGLQFILPPGHKKREQIGRDKTYWPPGLQKQGHFFTLGNPQAGGIILIAEGYATAATLFEATGHPTIVAFDAGNLAPVSEVIAKHYRRARILVCADDDYLTDGNPGVTAAQAAALAVDGAHLAPAFTVDRAGKKLTDFNDLAAIEGLHVVRGQVETQVRRLGWVAQHASPARPDLEGGEGGVDAFHFSIDWMREHLTLIATTETVFDHQRGIIWGLGPLRSAAGKGNVRIWLEDHQRHAVLPDQVGFDPSGHDENIVCNIWRGWPSSAVEGRCDDILAVLRHLVDGEDDPAALYAWIIKWLAYPIQHPGAKMQTALLIHGPEGTGKNLVFGAVRQIYGRYGCIFSQTELESQFNGWSSGKLFGIGNEVVTRAELYHQQGRLRNMITEPEWQVNEKNLPTRLEANHCNFVFFSNRLDIAKLDPDDRRYCVVWTPPPAGGALYEAAADELRNGGTAALHHHLLNVELADFDPHTKPPITRSKRELIHLSMDSTERFYQEVSDPGGELGKLLRPATQDQYHHAYILYCRRIGVQKPAQQATLCALFVKKPGWQRERTHVRHKTGAHITQRFLLPPGARYGAASGLPPKMDWLAECMRDFDLELSLLQDQGLLPYAIDRGSYGKKKADEATEEWANAP